MTTLLLVLTLLSSPQINYRGLLGEFLPYNAYHFVDLIEDGDFKYARNDFASAESLYHQAYNYAHKIKNYKLLTVSLISWGTALGSQNKTETSLEKFKQALKNKDIIFNDSILSLLFYNLGVAYHNLQYPDSAINYYSLAISSDSAFYDAFINRGNAYLLTQDYAEALDNFQKALQLRPASADVMVILADTYLVKNDKITARHWFDQAIKNKENLKDYPVAEVQNKLNALLKVIHE